MGELTYEDFVSRGEGAAPPASPVYLVHGDNYRIHDICERLLIHLVGEGSRDLMVDRLEGTDEVVHLAVDRLNTFALLAGRKIVLLPDARFFFGKQDAGALLESALKACKSDQKPKAALHLMKYLALKELHPDDPEADIRQALASDLPAGGKDVQWAAELLDYCRQSGLTPPPVDDAPLARLERALEKGFPAGNRLIITTESVDKRKSLFKTITERGTIIDCRLPTGDRMADRKVQEQAMADTAERLLRAAGKTLAPEARKILNERIGCDLRRYAGNIEKLITYAGERTAITAADVRHLVAHTRQEPIYALTGALAERNAPAAILLFRRMLADEAIHPLQALSAIANQVRRLMVARTFIDSPLGRGWRPEMPYAAFGQQIMPSLLSFQEQLGAAVAAVADPGVAAESGAGAKGRRKSGFPAELMPARNPKSPFPIFHLLRHASMFTMAELVAAMGALAAADGELKRYGGQDGAPVEKAILAIAAPGR